MRRFSSSTLIFALTAAALHGAIISAPDIDISPAPNQPVNIFMSGSDINQIQSVALFMSLPAGPIFTSVDSGNPYIDVSPWPDPSVYISPDGRELYFDKIFHAPIVSPMDPLLICTLRLDATGVQPGTYALLFSNSAGDSETYPVPSQFISGTITVTPEPAALALLAVGGLLCGCRRRKPAGC